MYFSLAMCRPEAFSPSALVKPAIRSWISFGSTYRCTLVSGLAAYMQPAQIRKIWGVWTDLEARGRSPHAVTGGTEYGGAVDLAGADQTILLSANAHSACKEQPSLCAAGVLQQPLSTMRGACRDCVWIDVPRINVCCGVTLASPLITTSTAAAGAAMARWRAV